jgi:CRISPR/Cas system-associated endoribonuclease Cas2
MMTWMFAYDAQCDQRRHKIAKAIRREGIPIQKSVLLVQATISEVRTLTDSLAKIIDRKTDRILTVALAKRLAKLTELVSRNSFADSHTVFDSLTPGR